MLPQVHAGKIIPKIGVMHDWKVLLFFFIQYSNTNKLPNTLLLHMDLTY